MNARVVIAPTVAYSWLATQPAKHFEPAMFVMAWELPVALTLFLMRRVNEISNAVLRMAEYMKSIERVVADHSLGGWEHYIAENQQTKRQRRILRLADLVYWCWVLALWIVVSSLATYKQVFELFMNLVHVD